MIMQPLFYTPGGVEIAILIGLAVLLFGAEKIPELARESGRAIHEFQEARTNGNKDDE